ncbi:MAG TPA: aminotransferase class III-fold pyridoxal phosphate-dependent enzyme [Pyrinomonadaceae bacterium]|nr:aminotransferase class III-fold pyridoxal phosphate-dependent enzyme [Pyrinomonadaceae bacterium]
MACAVALASLDLFSEYEVLKRVQSLEQQMKGRFSTWSSSPFVGDVRVIGGVGIIELVADKESKAAGGYFDLVGVELYKKFIGRNLLLRPLGNVLYFMPPYVISEEETHWALDQIEEVVQSLGRQAVS